MRLASRTMTILALVGWTSILHPAEPTLWPDLCRASAAEVSAAVCRLAPFSDGSTFQCECAAFGKRARLVGSGPAKDVAGLMLIQRSSQDLGLLLDTSHAPFSLYSPEGIVLTDGTKWFLSPVNWQLQANAASMPQSFVNGKESEPPRSIEVDVGSILQKYLAKAQPRVNYSTVTLTFTIRKETPAVIYIRGRTPNDSIKFGSDISEIATVGGDRTGIRLRGCLTNSAVDCWRPLPEISDRLTIESNNPAKELIRDTGIPRPEAASKMEEAIFFDLKPREKSLRKTLEDSRQQLVRLLSSNADWKVTPPAELSKVVLEILDAIQSAHQMAEARLGATDDPILYGMTMDRYCGMGRGEESLVGLMEVLMKEPVLEAQLRYQLAEFLGECGAPINAVPPWNESDVLTTVIKVRWCWDCSVESLELCRKALGTQAVVSPAELALTETLIRCDWADKIPLDHLDTWFENRYLGTASSSSKRLEIASSQPSGRQYLIGRLKRGKDSPGIRERIVSELIRRKIAVEKSGRTDFLDETEIAEISALSSGAD